MSSNYENMKSNMNDLTEPYLILAENLELAHLRLSQVRQELLDRRMLGEWQKLIEASAVLDAAQSRLVEMLRQQSK